MKYTIPFLLFFSLLYSCMNTDSNAQFSRLWSAITNAPTEIEEKKAVDTMRAYLLENSESYAVYSLDNKGNLQNIQSSPSTSKQEAISSYELHIGQGKAELRGKNWKPKSIDNVYAFFLE